MYIQCTVFCPRARGAGRISRPIPAGGVWTRQRQPQICQDSFLGKMVGGGGGGFWSLDFSNPAGCIPSFFLIFPTHKEKDGKGGGASASRIPLLRTGTTTLRRNKGDHEKRCLAFPKSRETSQTVGERGPTPISPRQRPSMPASYLLSARQVLRIRVLSVWYQVVLQRQAFFPARHKKKSPEAEMKCQKPRHPCARKLRLSETPGPLR